MATVTKIGIKCNYKCSSCNIDYSEQRLPEESQFFINCQKIGCDGKYELVNQEEFSFEQELPDEILP